MKKILNHFICGSLLMTSLSTFNVPSAIAQDVRSIASAKELSSDEVIRDAFAKFTLSVTADSANLRQALTQASAELASHKVSNQELIAYATSDMNRAEAKAFRSQIASLESADAEETQEILAKIMKSQSSGSNFFSCYYGPGLVTWTVGIAALVLAAQAYNFYDNSKDTGATRQLDKDITAIQSEIDIFKAEGVSDNSYLITTRKAEIAQLRLGYQVIEDNKQADLRDAQIYAGAAAAATVATAVSWSKCW